MAISVLLISVNYPNQYYNWAPWNKEANINISKLEDIKAEIVAPIPFSLPVKYFPYNKLAKIPLIENGEEGKIHRPKFLYLLPKKLFYGVTGDLYSNYVSNYALKNMDKPDLIHVHHLYPDGYVAMKLCKKWSIPLVVDIHSSSSIKSWFDNRTTKTKTKEILNYAHKIICINSELYESLKIGYGNKVEHIPLGVDINKFKPRNNDNIRKNFGIGEEKVILFVGRLVKLKGIELLLKALSQVNTNKNFKVFIVGDGPERKNLLDMSNTLNLKDKVVFTGELREDELFNMYSLSDLFVLPSLTEGRPMVIYEAMASECVIIATNVGGIPEQIKSDYNGFLVKSGNINELTEKIEYVLENEEIMEKMKKNSRKRIIDEDWTWEGYSRKIAETYTKLMDG